MTDEKCGLLLIKCKECYYREKCSMKEPYFEDEKCDMKIASEIYYLILGFGCALLGIIIQNRTVEWKFSFFLIMMGLFIIVMGKLIAIENELKNIQKVK